MGLHLSFAAMLFVNLTRQITRETVLVLNWCVLYYQTYCKQHICLLLEVWRLISSQIMCPKEQIFPDDGDSPHLFSLIFSFQATEGLVTDYS